MSGILLILMTGIFLRVFLKDKFHIRFLLKDDIVIQLVPMTKLVQRTISKIIN